MAEHWSIDEVAAHVGAATSRSATRTLSRWGIKAAGYERSDSGRARAMYPAAEVRAAKESRPGRGARTDLPAATGKDAQ